MSHFHSSCVNAGTPRVSSEHKQTISMMDVLFIFNMNIKKTKSYILVLAWDIFACFGKALDSNWAIYEFMI